MRRWWVPVSAMLATTLMASPPSAVRADDDDVPIAVIDLQGAVMQTEDGIRAQATLKKLLDRRQGEIKAKEKRLAKMKDDIELQSKFLSREALGRHMEVWQREMILLQGSFVDYQKELKKKQDELSAPIIQRMVAIIAKLARQNGHALVLDRSAAPYARPDLDLTDRVVQMYNAGESG